MSIRTYMGFEIVETDSGYGARPIDSDKIIGMAGTFQGYKSIRELKDQIKESWREWKVLKSEGRFES